VEEGVVEDEEEVPGDYRGGEGGRDGRAAAALAAASRARTRLHVARIDERALSSRQAVSHALSSA
jgi:hypothetical protein